ncbi:zinc finger CCCH domain-containing protein 25 [Neltuma alba]|uniref:zinc finger CCCH domain-containing protein 25 n=1 Tax=Neltuma alba TaxID=207710 RepID=UPI0010A57441|nr:zinc finger CCCH domain-containing protein 25 [Prosopis alba]
MTIDDESSIYVGGLPYGATEDTIRTVFDLYGAILDVKIINDVRTRGKCYCFVTFTNPRSAFDAINDMNGRTIDGRVVKVNGVRTRGGRSNFGRELIHHDTDRNGDWDRGRDQDPDYNHDRDRHRNRSRGWSRERDRSREHDRSRGFDYEGDRRYEHGRYHDQEREPLHVKDRSQERHQDDDEQERGKVVGQAVQRDYDLDYDTDREIDRTYDPDRSFDGDRNEHSRRNNGLNVAKRPNIDFSSDSNGNHDDEIADQLERSTQRLGQLKKEVSQLEEKLQEKRCLVVDLQKQSRKLEDALINAKKHSSYRQMQLTKLHKCFMQVKEYTERLKTCEKELQTMVDTAMLESDGDGEAVGLKDAQIMSGYV